LAALQSEHEIATDSLRAELEESQQQARELEQQYSDMENDVAQACFLSAVFPCFLTRRIS
jgi:multidrug resistance efflux pump